MKSLRGGVIRGLNVTVPFKERALTLATNVSERAKRAGAANLLIFEPTGRDRRRQHRRRGDAGRAGRAGAWV